MDSVIARDIALIIHIIGITMGLGTSFAFMFLGIASQKLEPAERTKFTLRTMALAKMGHIGLVLLLLSGGFLATPYWSIITHMPLFITKLILFVILGGLIGMISSNAKKAKKGDAELYLKKIETLGKLTFVIGIAIVTLAVLTFH